MTPAIPELPAATGTSGEHDRRGVSSPDPLLQRWGTGGSSAPCPAGGGPWSRCTYWVPHDRGDTVPCQPMPHEEGTH